MKKTNNKSYSHVELIIVIFIGGGGGGGGGEYIYEKDYQLRFLTRRADYRYCYHGNPCWCYCSCIDSLH